MDASDINPYAAPQSNAVYSDPATPTEAPSAGQGKRFLNFLIDRVVMVGFFFVLGVVLVILDEKGIAGGVSENFEHIDGVADILLSCIGTILYYTFFESVCGRSVGKMITGTKVVTVSGAPLTFGSALLRSLSRLVPFEAFSFLGSGVDTGWHDKWTDTRVIDLRAKPVIKPRPMAAGSMPRMYTPQVPVRANVLPPPSNPL